MDWLFFALLSTASFAVTVIIDKLLLNRYVRNSTAYLIALIIIQQFFAALILITFGTGFNYPTSIYGMLVGTAQASMYVAYIRALQIGIEAHCRDIGSIRSLICVLIFISSSGNLSYTMLA